MPINTRLGIHWDPREPPPPEYQPPTNAPLQQHVIYHPPPLQRAEVNENSLPLATRSILHPLSTSLVAKVVHDTANVSVTQLFWNKTNSTIGKGTYSFPLPTGCTVVDFSCRVGGNRIVRGRVKPKVEAREAFNDAARRDQTATLLEQETPEIFTTTVANIPANTKLQAEISFITLLKHTFLDSSNTTTLTIPTCIASRYDTPPELLHTQEISRFQDLSIQVEILAVEDIKSIISKTHNVNVQMGVGRSNSQSWSEFVARRTGEDPRAAFVTLADRIPFLDRDLVIDIMTLPQNGAEAPHACMETHPSFENHKAVMLTIPPKFMLKNESPVHDAEILFVADRSGSMEDKIESLKSAMSFFLKGIPQAQRFNVWCFGTSYTYLWPRSKMYSESTLQEALAYVLQQFKPDMGGTELLPALKAIVDARGGFQMTDVILLTDGEVWRLDETIDFIQQTRRTTGGRMRFFALGIGDAVSHELVEGIAKAGGGYAEVIPAASQGGWEDRLVAVLHAALTGHIGPLRMEVEGGDGHESRFDLVVGESGTRPKVLQSPADISALSPFLQNRVFLLFDSATSPSSFDAVNIKATTPNGHEVFTRVPVKALHKKATTLHRLGARALLGDLERGQSWIHLGSHGPRRNASEELLTRKEGERLGSKWSLVSKWTSFYAIEEPYEAPGNAQDPFLDVDEPQIHHVAANDLNLLRPRGHMNPNPAAALRLESGAPIDEQAEEEDENTSGSDSTDAEDMNHDSSDDSGSDDDGAGGNGTGRSTGQPQAPNTSRGRPHQERDSGDRNDGPRNGSNNGSAQERVHNIPPGLGYVSAYGSSTSNADTSLGSSNTNAGNHTLTLNTVIPTFHTPQNSLRQTLPLSIPLPLSSQAPAPPPSTVSSQLPKSLSPPSSRLPSTPIPKLPLNRLGSFRLSPNKYTSFSTISNTPGDLLDSKGDSPSLSFLPLEMPPTKSDDYYYSVPESPPPQKTSRWSSSLFTKGRKSKSMGGTKNSLRAKPVHNHECMELDTASELPSDSRLPSPVTSLGDKNPLVGISELSSFDTRGWGAGKTAGALSELSDPVPLSESTSRHVPKSTADLAELSTEFELDRESWEEDRAFRAPLSRVFEMSAPIHNPPASTAILSTSTNTPKSSKDIEKESLVRRLLALQNFDGSFLFTEGHKESFFGKAFRNATHELELNLHKISINQAEKYNIAVAIAIIVELEERYQSCKDLWLMIVQKARHFVDIWLGGFEKENVFEFAKYLLGLNDYPQASDAIQDVDAGMPAKTSSSAAGESHPVQLPSVTQSSSAISKRLTSMSNNKSWLNKPVTSPVTSSPSLTAPTRPSWLGKKFHRKIQSRSEKKKPGEKNKPQTVQDTDNMLDHTPLEEEQRTSVDALPSSHDAKRMFASRRRPGLGRKSKNLVIAKAQLETGKAGQNLDEGQQDAALFEI